MKLKTCIFSIIALIAIASFTAAVSVRKSYIDDLSQKPYIELKGVRLSVFPDINEVFWDSSVNDSKSLYDSADVIVKVKADGERLFNSDMSISCVTVNKTIKGEVDEKIYVVEPIFYYEGSNIACSVEGYKWMLEDKEYLLFLKRIRSAGFVGERNMYVPTTAKYSKYALDNEYKDVDDQEYINLRKEIIEGY